MYSMTTSDNDFFSELYELNETLRLEEWNFMELFNEYDETEQRCYAHRTSVVQQ